MDEVSEFCQRLRAKNRSHIDTADQLKDTAGSVGANLAEAKDGESKKDFIHKNCLALKEANESKYWLQRAWSDERSLRSRAEPLIQEAGELIAILTAIVVNAKIEPKPWRQRGLTGYPFSLIPFPLRESPHPSL